LRGRVDVCDSVRVVNGNINLLLNGIQYRRLQPVMFDGMFCASCF